MEKADKLLPIEIKSGQTVAGDFFENLKKFQSIARHVVGRGFLLYGGQQTQNRETVDVVPWSRIHDLSAVIRA